MKLNHTLGLVVSLPLWLLAGCGGGSSSGTDGATSVTPSSAAGVSSGTITGFGSVFVNGVRYNTDNATVFRGDDQLNDVRELAVGMVVRVEGSIDDRIARSVRYAEDVKGPADGAAVGNRLSVMGQTVVTDAGTVFNNTSLASIAPGDLLEISGLRNGNDDIVAHFVERKTAPASVNRYSVIGNVRDLDSNARTFRIDDLLISYASADVNDLTGGTPVAGQLVEVKDDSKTYAPGSLSLDATKVEPHSRLGNTAASGTRTEIEAIVTRVNSSNEFEIGGLTVRTTPLTLFRFGAPTNVAVGTRLEVEGVLGGGGVLEASKIKFEDNDARILAHVDLGGVDGAGGTVMLLDVPVTVSNATKMEDKRDGVSPYTLNDTAAGDYLEARGFLGANGAFIATDLVRDDDDTRVELRGPAGQTDPVAGTVNILGVTVNTASNTQYRGFDDQPIAAAQFFDAIVDGLTLVQARWDPFTDVSAPVRELELED